jgi:acetyltransferase
VLAGLADWGTVQNIGFSHLISMGVMINVDFGDVAGEQLARHDAGDYRGNLVPCLPS